MVAVVDELPGGNHAGLVAGVDGDVGRDVPFLQQLPQSPVTVPDVSRQRHREQGEFLDQPRDRFRFSFRDVGYASGQDEPAAVYDDVLLVL